MSNLDLFNEISGKIFSECYKNFPVPVHFRQKDFFPEIDENDTYDPFYFTLMWLKEYGYITFWEPGLPATEFLQTQLTEKALMVLNSVPSSLTSSNTLGQKLIVLAKDGSKEGFREIVRQIISLGCSSIPVY